MLFALPGLSFSNSSRALLGALAQWWSWGLVAPLIFWTDARLPSADLVIAEDFSLTLGRTRLRLRTCAACVSWRPLY